MSVQDIRSALQAAEHRIRIELPRLGVNDLRAVVDDAEQLFELIAKALREKTPPEEP